MIYANSIEMLYKHFKQVLKRLKESNLHIRDKKCLVGYKNTEYLGYLVSGTEIYKDMSKT